MANKNNKWFVIGGVVIFILVIILIVIQVQNSQRQAEIQRELQRVAEEKQFCDNLQIGIRSSDIAGFAGGVANVGVNYCFYSNSGTSAKSVITLKNGRVIEEEETLQENSCMIQQLTRIAGFQGSGYQGNVVCSDLQSIELISTRCPQVKSLITDTSKITCGM